MRKKNLTTASFASAWPLGSAHYSFNHTHIGNYNNVDLHLLIYSLGNKANYFKIDSVSLCPAGSYQSVTSYSADIKSHTDYYPFGQSMPGRTWVPSPEQYRYSHNGHEREDAIFPNAQSVEFWMYDSRIGRRWEMDPLTLTWHSPYATFNNNPIALRDKKGLAADPFTKRRYTSGRFRESIGKFFGAVGGGIVNGLKYAGAGIVKGLQYTGAAMKAFGGKVVDLAEVVINAIKPTIENIKNAHVGVRQAVFKVTMPENVKSKEFYDQVFKLWSYDGTTERAGTNPKSIYRNVVSYGVSPTAMGGANYSNLNMETELIGRITGTERSTNHV